MFQRCDTGDFAVVAKGHVELALRGGRRGMSADRKLCEERSFLNCRIFELCLQMS